MRRWRRGWRSAASRARVRARRLGIRNNRDSRSVTGRAPATRKGVSIIVSTDDAMNS